jgi:hypothetical protein
MALLKNWTQMLIKNPLHSVSGKLFIIFFCKHSRPIVCNGLFFL